ncbi:MAG TPA: hypothetical protein VMU48_11775 [Terracidiphilus sp.]|nr:hypothetical protein [Terracidiphilus sp.]
MPKVSPNNLPPLLTWEIENGYIEPIMASSITLQQMREKLIAARKKLELAKREVTAWEQVVAVEESNAGLSQPVVETTNKSAVLRDYLQSKDAQKGVTYKMIHDFYEMMDVPIATNFVYNLIDKWEQKGDVEKRDGKIFWSGERTQKGA